jgi:hypothetical protein
MQQTMSSKPIPSMDEILADSHRNESRSYLVLGLILLGSAVVLGICSYSLFSGRLVLVGSVSGLTGLVFVLRGIRGFRRLSRRT